MSGHACPSEKMKEKKKTLTQEKKKKGRQALAKR